MSGNYIPTTQRFKAALLDIFSKNFDFRQVQLPKLHFYADFKKANDVDQCHVFCGHNAECHWWSWEGDQNLCVLFRNCTALGEPDQTACPTCISGQRL